MSTASIAAVPVDTWHVLRQLALFHVRNFVWVAPADCDTTSCACGFVQAETNAVQGKQPFRELSGEGSARDQEEEALANAKRHCDSPIQNMFTGMEQVTMTCKACGRQNHNFFAMVDLQLELPEKGPVTLQASLCFRLVAAGLMSVSSASWHHSVLCQRCCAMLRCLLQVSHATLHCCALSSNDAKSEGQGCHTGVVQDVHPA